MLIMMVMGVGNAWADTWDGTTKTAPDMSTYNGSSEALAIQITNAEELAWLGDQMRQGLTANGKASGGKYWKLMADIDLGGKADFTGNDWASMIGNTTSAFCGYFDGGGHTVSNIQVNNATSKMYYGLFPSIQGASTTNVSSVKNLKINGAYFKATAPMASTTRIAALAGYVKQATVSDIDISNVKFVYTGGITAENDLGGAIGCAEATVSIESVSVSTVDADFTGTTTNLYVAGLVGKINSLTSVSKCSTSDVTITYNTIANASRISGLIGYTKGAANAPITINGCSVSNTKVDLKAGINNGSFIGALVGQTADNTQIGDGTEANKNTVTSPDINIGGDIKAASYIGGAIGDLAGATDLTKTSVVKNLTVTSPKITVNNYSAGTSLTGGVFGRVSTYTAVDGVNLTGATLSFTKDLSVAQQIGTFAGTITGNATQQISVKNVTIDKSNLTFGSSNTSNTVGLKAGLIGQLATNVLLDTWTISGNSSITINGNIRTTPSQIGNFVGNVTGDTNGPVTIKNVTFSGNVTTNITGAMSVKDCKIGGAIGQMASAGKVNNPMEVNNLVIEGTTNVTIGGECTTAVYVGGFAAHYASNASQDNSAKLTDITLSTTNININGEVKAASYFGGLIGYTTIGCDFQSLTIDTPTLTFGSNVAAASFIGGAIGDFVGANGYTSTIKALTVKSPTISVNNYSAGATSTGGVFGLVSTFTDIDGVSVEGTSTISATVSVAQNIGSVAGNFTGNATQQIVAKNVTIENSSITFGTNTESNTIGPKAGIVGYVSNNTLLDTWTVTGNNNITVNGNLITTGSQLGGFVGGVAGANGGPVVIKKIVFEKANNVTLAGNVGVASYIGGFIGNTTGNGNPGSGITISDITLKEPNVTIGGQVTTAASHFGGMVGYATIACAFSDLKTTDGTKLTLNGNITNTANVGGILGSLIGTAAYPSKLSSINSQKATLTINGDVSGTLYLGGLVGNLNIATISESSVSKADIVLNGNNTNNMYVGGAVGYMTQTVAPFATVEKVTVKDSKIHTSGTHTYAKGNKPLVVGGLVGYMPQEATKFTDVHNCIVDNIDINLGGYIPETANTSGNLYNQQQNAFVVGGVIGRINTPSRLPEYLYFSGKINAPFAMVAPVVGVFLTSISSANYAFDDYTGANAPNVTNQWQKALTWYYTDYNLGLSTAVRTQTARTRNYTASTTNIGGVEYLNIQSNTLLEYNGLGNISKTVLRYDISGTNRDFGLFPAWNATSATYPEYYMYYMQGVNRGKYVESGMAEAAKSIVLNGMLYTLDFSQSADRSFAKTFTVSSTEQMDSYEWYINGEKQSETSNQYSTVFTIEQVADPNTNIYIYGIKEGQKVAMATGVPSRVLLRVKDESQDISTYGTKTNPYLIGGTYGAQELQLLSYLSTLDNNIKWEGNFISSTHYNRAYYELESDIDLSGIADFTPISLPKSNNTDGTSSGYHQNFVFDGVFEGNHHTISGLNIGWYAGALNTNDQNMGWGLFAAVGNPTAQKKVGEATASNAVIKNLIIDGATLTHRTDNTSFYYNNGVSGNANYCMVGVLAGIVSNNVTIQDIEIRNSKITDEGSRNYSLATKGLYVGGAIGSYQTGFNATNNAQVNSLIQHIAAQVDITLTRPQIADVSAVAQLSQFNVGGIIGRYIATSATKDQAEAAMPKYTIYSGIVKTPRAWVSPVLGALRYKDQNGLTVWTNYSKQYDGNNNSDATQIHIANAHYYNFYIDADKITDAFPTNTCKSGSRTLSAHVDIVESAILYNALKYQGVNYEAKYIDMEGASLEYLNENRTDGYNWLWEDGFVHLSTDPYVEARISRSANIFTASLEGATAVGYTWKLSFDGETWYDIPNETNATYTAQESPKQKFIRAFVSDGTKEYPTLSMVVEAVEICTPAISYTEDSESRTYTADLNVVDGIDISHLEIEYQWYDWNKELIPGATNPTYAITMDDVNQHREVVWCVVTIKEIGFTMAEYTLMAGGTVVYVDGTNGIDNVDGSTERGWTDLTPVKTIDHANSLLKSKDEGGTMDNNIIVIMGVLNPQAAGVNHTNLDKDKYTNRFQSHGKNPATLTGKYGSTDYNGEIILCEYWSGGAESNVNDYEHDGHNCYVLADTKFEYLTFSGSNTGNNFIECHGNDVTFGKGLKMEKFRNLTKNHGNFNGSQIIPELTIVLTATNPSEVTIETYTNREKPQVVTFQSGHYGRIMGGRYTQGFFSVPGNTSHSILGSAKHPIWAEVNIDIDNDNQKSGYVQKNADNLPASSGTYDYTCDINALVAGLTDGTMYGDYTINFHGGTISYIVGGNQGNPVPNGTAVYKNIGVNGDEFSKAWGQWPNASYFGRSVINIDQQEGMKNITIDNIYAGGLGRQANGDNAKSIVDMYVYGQIEVNIKGGTVNNCVYAGGAGGVLGQNPWDAHTPYATSDPDDAAAGILNGVQYGDTRVGTWSSKTANAALATVTLHNRLEDGTYEEFPLNLANSSATINISGGSVNGDVYGGGFGQVEDMPAAVTMQGVGSVFGKTYINISGGTITGSVYGGSRGSSVYYHEVNKYGQTIDHIAEMNGTIYLTIFGTEDKYPYIKSAIYGAGRGLSTAQRKATQADVDAGKADNVGDTYTEEYPRIATAGNTDLGDGYRTNINITIDLPESIPFPNDIYGGGQMGLVDGDINIVLKRGTLTGNIYGGGYGEREHLDKAKVTGDTKISTGAEDVAEVDVNTPVTISGGVNIYGGGDMAQVKGNTFINLNHGNITANVFGGGRGLTQSDSGTFTDYGKVTGNTRVWINNQTPDNILTGNIYGGGALGAVQGNTTVVVKAGEVDGDVFGGGQGEEGSEKAKVTGNTNVIVDKNWEPTPPTP